MKKIKILKIENYDDVINDCLENLANEFDYNSSKKMLENRKAQFIKFIEPIFKNELQEEFNKNPEILKKNFKNEGNGVYISNTGVKLTIEEKD
ncbi:hypothetical protein ACWCL1_08300 [Ligilactobacillus sp. LYQ135]